jgi:hypothetical protein
MAENLATFFAENLYSHHRTDADETAPRKDFWQVFGSRLQFLAAFSD